MECKDCGKYTVSCSVLEGFECCKCCGIGECEYDDCPPEEKLPISLTVTEFRYFGEVSYAFNMAYNSKDAFLDSKFTRNRYYDYQSAYKGFIGAKRDVIESDNIREHVKRELLSEINSGISTCRDLTKLILNKVNKTKKGGSFSYYKRNLAKFKPETIGKIKNLSRKERYKLLKLKGIGNPRILID